MNPAWQQQKLKEYCAKKGITITAYSPLGGQINFIPNAVLTSDVLKEIADAKGKSVAQVPAAAFYCLYTEFLKPYQ
jgi:3''-deamino-3''-oxonicotianamine reductase